MGFFLSLVKKKNDKLVNQDFFFSFLSPQKRSGTSAALVLHTYLVCAHISITQLGPTDEATCDLRMSVARSPSDLNNPEHQGYEDNK